MNENKKYLEKILSRFLQFGIKSISMDDIAEELGISKKKLYQIFKDKTAIVEQSVELLQNKMCEICNHYNRSSLNVIEKEIEHQNRYIDTYLKIKPTFIYDLKKFHPDINNSLGKFKRDLIYSSSCKLVEDGIKQGLFREDIDPEYIAKINITLAFAFFHPDLNEVNEQDLTSRHFYMQHFLFQMNGLCTEKGRLVLNELMRNSDLDKENKQV